MPVTQDTGPGALLDRLTAGIRRNTNGSLVGGDEHGKLEEGAETTVPPGIPHRW